MRWPIKWFEQEPDTWEVGYAFYHAGYPLDRLSAQYHNERRRWRPPICVIVPRVAKGIIVSCQMFCVDSAYWENGQPTALRTGWQVTGDKGLISMSPSIQLGAGEYVDWHGWIRDGFVE